MDTGDQPAGAIRNRDHRERIDAGHMQDSTATRPGPHSMILTIKPAIGAMAAIQTLVLDGWAKSCASSESASTRCSPLELFLAAPN